MAQVVVPPRLISLLSSWGADPEAVARAATDLAARYCEPHRRYHTLEHIHEMLAVCDRIEATEAVNAAVWFHDAVYDPARVDNESRSAAYAHESVESLGAPAVFAGEVARLVRTTAQHEPEDGDLNGRTLADADLAILGAPRDRYERYVRDVRAEYAQVSDDDWRTGRAAVLNTFLARPTLFHALQLRDALEGPARGNLRAELVALSSS